MNTGSGAVLAMLAAIAAGAGYTGPCSADGTVAARIKHGEYLVGVGSCNDCHSPKVATANGPMPDPKRLLSGHPAGTVLGSVPDKLIGPASWGGVFSQDLTAWYGPWGTSFAANLTPDMETGLGGWTEQTFIQAMRTGKHLGVGRDILPPMPWFNLARLSDDDLKAIFAYLRSLPPVRNAVPAPLPPQAK